MAKQYQGRNLKVYKKQGSWVVKTPVMYADQWLAGPFASKAEAYRVRDEMAD